VLRFSDYVYNPKINITNEGLTKIIYHAGFQPFNPA
jgi:hypothetical protein